VWGPDSKYNRDEEAVVPSQMCKSYHNIAGAVKNIRELECCALVTETGAKQMFRFCLFEWGTWTETVIYQTDSDLEIDMALWPKG
jgi:hypothetical protein